MATINVNVDEKIKEQAKETLEILFIAIILNVALFYTFIFYIIATIIF